MTRSQLFVDTGYLIARYDQNDKYHRKAMEWESRLRSETRELFTTSVVLAEFGDGFCKATHFEPTLKWLGAVVDDQSIGILPVCREDIQRARDLRVKYRDKKGLDLTDCISFVIMRDLDITEALACDKHFEHAGFTALLRW